MRSSLKDPYMVMGEEVYDFFDRIAIDHGYELREGQMDMACEIVDALKEHTNIMVEAGVGIGKSFAYIIVALSYIKRFGGPVIIATSTIALQEQLIDDIEKVLNMLRCRAEVLVAKGQSHYICMKRSNDYFVNADLKGKNAVIHEAIKNGSGERTDFKIKISEYVWDRINVQNYKQRFCAEKCPYIKSCRYYKLRGALQRADEIIVCNQDLLIADLKHRVNGQNEIFNGKKKMIITGFFAYSAVFLITFLCGEGLIWGFIVAVCASIPMAILGILPQACVADVAELSRLETGEDRSGMFFAARTFAFKMGQAIALAVFTSMTAIANVPGTTEAAAAAAYRRTALVAFICCVIGACLFFLFKEKEILAKIEKLKGEEK